MLGLYVSDHPLAGAGTPAARTRRDRDRLSLLDEDAPDGQQVVIAGLIAGLQRRGQPRRARPGPSPPSRTCSASIEVLFFPKNYEVFAPELTEGVVVAVRGRVNRRENAVSVVGMDMMVLDISTGHAGRQRPGRGGGRVRTAHRRTGPGVPPDPAFAPRLVTVAAQAPQTRWYLVVVRRARLPGRSVTEFPQRGQGPAGTRLHRVGSTP